MSNFFKPQSDSEFNSILDSHRSDGKLLVIDFNATWCGPCRMMAPILETESRQRPHVIFISADTDKCPGASRNYGVTAIPNFVFLKNGQVLTQFSGANVSKLKESLDTYGKEEPQHQAFSGSGYKLTDNASTVNQETLSALVEMGFPRDLAFMALSNKNSLEDAIEWIDEYQSKQTENAKRLGSEKKNDDVTMDLGCEKKDEAKKEKCDDDDDVTMVDANTDLTSEKKKCEEEKEEEEKCDFEHDSFCDECSETIVGILYRCESCDIDLCSNCIGEHDKTHDITKNNGVKTVKYNESFSGSVESSECEKKESADSDVKKAVPDVMPADAITDGIPPEDGEYSVQYYCDGCGNEIKGASRHRCETCGNYDLCEECYQKGIHDKTHKFKDFPVFTLENYKQIMSERRQKKAAQMEKEAQEKEIKRIKEGKAAQDDRERAQELRRKKDDEIRKKAYEEQRRYEIDVLRRIERDRQERLRKMNPDAVKSQGNADGSQQVRQQPPQKVYAVSKAVSECTVAKLKVRLPNGTNLTNSFDPDATLKTVYLWVEERYMTPTGAPFCFKCMSPNAHFTFDQMDITLRQAKLVPSAVLMVTNK